MATLTLTRRPNSSGAAGVAGRLRTLVRLPLTWLCVLTAAPVAVAAAREIAIGWIPEGDDAMLATRIRDVFTGHPPLQGMRSTSNFFDAKLSTHHPGPLEFYLDAPIAAVTGYSGAGIVLAAALLNVVCITGAVIMAYRMRRLRTALPVAGGLLLAQWQLGPDVLARPLNPSAGTLPVVLMIVGAWAVFDRDPHGLWVTLIAGSFAAQTELAFCPLVLIVAGAACLVSGARAWRDSRRWRTARSSARSGRRRHVLTIVALVLAWLPSIIELFVIHPNNVRMVLRLLTNSTAGRGESTGVAGGFGYVVGRLSPTELGRFGAGIGQPPSGTAVGIGMVVLVLLLLAAAAGSRLPHTVGARGSWLMLLTIGAESIALSAKPDSVSAKFWLLPVLVITPMVYAVLILRAIEVARWRQWHFGAAPAVTAAPRGRSLLAGITAVAVGATLASALTWPPSAEESDRARTVSDTVVTYLHDHARSGTAVRIDAHGLQSWISLAPALAFQLARNDHPAHYLGTWPYPEDNTSWYAATAPPDAVIVTVADEGSVQQAHPGAGAVELPLSPDTAAAIRLWIAIPAGDRT